MKAWNVSDVNGDIGYSFIVFAETRGKAIKYAKDHCDGELDWYKWTEIRAIREPELDGFYHGKPMLEWSDMNDRLIMVKHAGFFCSYEIDVTTEECAACPAHEWCGRYESMCQ